MRESRAHISGKQVFKVLGGLLLFFLIVHGGSFLVFKILNRPHHVDPIFKSLFHEAQTKPPGPLLQSTPKADLLNFRKQEEIILNSYAWVDRSKGVIRIPIRKAMDLLVREQGGR